MTIEQLVSQVKISQVYVALGGKLIGKRGKAFYRDGDGLSLQFDDRQNFFKDHAQGTAGGVVKLIMTANDCSKSEAVAWLEDFTGSKLDSDAKADTGWQIMLAAQAWQKAAVWHLNQSAMKLHDERSDIQDLTDRWMTLTKWAYQLECKSALIADLRGQQLIEAYKETTFDQRKRIWHQYRSYKTDLEQKVEVVMKLMSIGCGDGDLMTKAALAFDTLPPTTQAAIGEHLRQLGQRYDHGDSDAVALHGKCGLFPFLLDSPSPGTDWVSDSPRGDFPNYFTSK